MGSNRHGLTAATRCLLTLALSDVAPAQEPPTPATGRTSMIATGRFDVSMTPASSDAGDGSTLTAMTLEKTFEGDLAGPSSGHILMVSTEVEGSAGYVAAERFTGTLHGRSGSFVMQHYGVMAADGDGQEHIVTIVPDTGTGELVGIRGSMTIEVGDDHTYELEYTLGAG